MRVSFLQLSHLSSRHLYWVLITSVYSTNNKDAGVNKPPAEGLTCKRSSSWNRKCWTHLSEPPGSKERRKETSHFLFHVFKILRGRSTGPTVRLILVIVFFLVVFLFQLQKKRNERKFFHQLAACELSFYAAWVLISLPSVWKASPRQIELKD